jgi:hypothetical protein
MGPVRWLAVAFWCSLFATTLALAWTIQCGIEAVQAPQRLSDVRSEGARLERAATERLAQAENELSKKENELSKKQMKADDPIKNATKSEPPDLESRARVAAGQHDKIEPLRPQIAAAQAEVRAAKQAVDDTVVEVDRTRIEVDRLTRQAWLERKQSQGLLLWSLIAVAAGAVVTSATGWVWRRAG